MMQKYHTHKEANSFAEGPWERTGLISHLTHQDLANWMILAPTHPPPPPLYPPYAV